jgi:tripartite motif-containing protein 71
MTHARRRRPHEKPRGRARTLAMLAIAALVALAGLAALADAAAAEACAGVGAAPCPYASAQIIGQRAEGVLRFPEAVALDQQGNVYVADQLSYVVQKFSAAGVFETEWGSYGGGHGQFGPIGGLATDAAGDVYVVDSSHNRIEKFTSDGSFVAQWGHKGDGPGQFNFGSSQDYTKPPGGGIAVAGSYVYVADSGNNRIERFNLEGGEAIEWGSKGSALGQFRYPRGVAASGTEVLVADDDNHRIERFDPSGAYLGEVGSQGSGPDQFGFPYGVSLDAAGNAYVADDLNHRVVKLSASLGFAGAWGGYGTKPGQLAFPRAVASDPAGDTYVANTANDRIEVYDPEGRFLRTIGL